MNETCILERALSYRSSQSAGGLSRSRTTRRATRSGLKQRNADFLSCSNKLTVQAGQRWAFLNSEVQVGGIVNSQAVLLSEGEHFIVRCWCAEAHVQLIQGDKELLTRPVC